MGGTSGSFLYLGTGLQWWWEAGDQAGDETGSYESYPVFLMLCLIVLS